MIRRVHVAAAVLPLLAVLGFAAVQPGFPTAANISLLIQRSVEADASAAAAVLHVAEVDTPDPNNTVWGASSYLGFAGIR